MGMKVLRGRRHCEEVILRERSSARALLTALGGVGLGGGVVTMTIEEATVTIAR